MKELNIGLSHRFLIFSVHVGTRNPNGYVTNASNYFYFNCGFLHITTPEMPSH